jgi:TolB-like protein/Tfp pilus assembly protein PilF
MNLIQELKRRNVFKVAIAYVVASWLLLQVTDVLVPILTLPDWAARLIFLFLLVGFIPALIFAWAFELTPDGLKKEKEVDRSKSIAPQTGRKLDRTIMAIMGVALIYFVVDKFFLNTATINEQPVAETAQVEESTLQSIAVLPLADMSPLGDHEYFSDGLTEELLNILAKVKDLRVAGRTSSFAFKGKNEDLREIAKKLDVKSILEGSVRKDDARNKVRITLQLINAEDGYHLWSETYDRDMDDIFTIQEEIAIEVAKALKITLLGNEGIDSQTLATTDLNAYDLYLRGLNGLNEFSYASVEQAENDFKQSLELDPAYMPSQIGLVRAWQMQANTGLISDAQSINRGKPLLDQVLKNDPQNVEALVLQAFFLRQDQDFDGAESLYRQALEIEPRNVFALNDLGGFLRDRERIEEAMPYIRRAAQIEPYSSEIQNELCWSYLWLSALEDALFACERMREIDPENPGGYYNASLAHRVAGDLANSILWDTRAFEIDPDDHELQAHLAEQWMGLGDLQKADEWLAKAEAKGPGEPATVATRVELLLHREQTALAAQLAARHLGADSRFFSDNIIRNAFVSDALNRGDTQAALETYRRDNAWVFEEPMTVDTDRSSWTAGDLVEIAFVLKSNNLASGQADIILDGAQSVINRAHPDLVHWYADINSAALEATRGNRQAAIKHLNDAYESGLRLRWRYFVQHWFVLEPIRDMPEYRQLVARFEADMEQQKEEAYRLQELGP